MSNIETKSKEGNVLAGFILYKDANMDWQRFKKSLKEDWDITCEEEVVENALVFEVDDMMVACSLMPNPVPNEEAELSAQNNIFWKEGPQIVKTHQAHVMLAVMNKFDPIAQSMLFTKVTYSLLKLENSIAVYKAPTVFQKDFYMGFASTIKDGEYPMPILIYVGMYLAKSGICAFTSGMKYYGKEEMEIVDSQKQPDEVISFLYSISEYVVVENVELKDGETIGFTEDQKLPIKVSDGVSVQGKTIKIKF